MSLRPIQTPSHETYILNPYPQELFLHMKFPDLDGAHTHGQGLACRGGGDPSAAGSSKAPFQCVQGLPDAACCALSQSDIGPIVPLGEPSRGEAGPLPLLLGTFLPSLRPPSAQTEPQHCSVGQ